MTGYYRYIMIFIFIVTACFFTAQGGTLYSSNTSVGKNPAIQPDSIIGNLSVAAGIPDHGIVKESKESTFEFPFTVTNGGRMSLVSGHSIVLKPGTRVVAGGYLRAAIVPDSRESKPGIHKSRNHQKTADAETDIPVVIAETHDAISPFAKKSGRGINESDNKEESLVAQVSEVSGISPGQQFKHALHSTTRKNSTTHRFLNSCSYHFIPLSETPETIAVLRL